MKLKTKHIKKPVTPRKPRPPLPAVAQYAPVELASTLPKAPKRSDLNVVIEAYPASSPMHCYEPAQIHSAIAAHLGGDFGPLARVWEQMYALDPDLQAVASTRLSALQRHDLVVEPNKKTTAEETQLSTELSAEISTYIYDCIPENEQKEWHFWYIGLGVSIGEWVWSFESDAWKPHLKVWHPEHLRWDDQRCVYQLNTKSGQITIDPSDPNHIYKWAILTDGRYGYRKGAALALGELYAGKRINWNDWFRSNKKNAGGFFLAKTPASAKDQDKLMFAEDLAGVEKNDVVIAPQNNDGQAGYDVELLEFSNTVWQTYESTGKNIKETYSILLLGQTLTTVVESGSKAAAEVHKAILDNKIDADAHLIGTRLRDTLLSMLCAVNYGVSDKTLVPFLVWDLDPPEETGKQLDNMIKAMDLIDKIKAINPAVTPQELQTLLNRLQLEIPVLAAPGVKA